MRPVVFDANFMVAATDRSVLPEGSVDAIKFRILLQELEKQKT
jgi:hypothetical protein